MGMSNKLLREVHKTKEQGINAADDREKKKEKAEKRGIKREQIKEVTEGS